MYLSGKQSKYLDFRLFKLKDVNIGASKLISQARSFKVSFSSIKLFVFISWPDFIHSRKITNNLFVCFYCSFFSYDESSLLSLYQKKKKQRHYFCILLISNAKTHGSIVKARIIVFSSVFIKS